MKIVAILLAHAISLVGPSLLEAAPSSTGLLTQADAALLLETLLEPAGQRDQAAQLARYREWGRLHDRYRADGQWTEEQARVYLFIVFVAHEKAMAEPQEEIAKEIVPLFVKHADDILSALKALPFLIPSTCAALGDHFDLFGTAEEKRRFLRRHSTPLSTALGSPYADQCLRKIRN